jgi:hypothetical protein
LFAEGLSITSESALGTIDELAWAMTRGGWPASLALGRQAAAMIPKNYLKAIEAAGLVLDDDGRSQQHASLDVHRDKRGRHDVYTLTRRVVSFQ